MRKDRKEALYRRLRLPEKRLERLTRIWPEKRPEEAARLADRRLLRRMALFAAAGSLLPAAVVIKGSGPRYLAASLLLLILSLLAPVIPIIMGVIDQRKDARHLRPNKEAEQE